MLKARPWGFELRNILKKQIDEIWERESINLHDTKLLGVLRPEVLPDGVFYWFHVQHCICQLLCFIHYFNIFIVNNSIIPQQLSSWQWISLLSPWRYRVQLRVDLCLIWTHGIYSYSRVQFCSLPTSSRRTPQSS